MLGLPSTVAVGRVIPKNAFYRNLKMTSALRDAFTHDVEKIEMAASIKEATCGIPAGEHVAEVVVLALDVRERTVPRDVVAAIIRGIPNKVLVACRHERERRIEALRRDVATLTRKHDKEKQIAKRNALFRQLKAAKRDLAELEN